MQTDAHQNGRPPKLTLTTVIRCVAAGCLSERTTLKTNTNYRDTMCCSRMPIRKDDPRNFRSVLIPKLVPVKDPTPSPRTHKSVSPVPPLVVASGSNYVPHKYFSPSSHTHIHVLFKQVSTPTCPTSVLPATPTCSLSMYLHVSHFSLSNHAHMHVFFKQASTSTCPPSLISHLASVDVKQNVPKVLQSFQPRLQPAAL